jgi:HEAT repeat protein
MEGYMDNKQIKNIMSLLLNEITAVDNFNLELIDNVIYSKINLLKNILDKDEEFKQKLIKSLLRNFKKVREQALSMSYKDKGFELQSHVQISLYTLIKKLTNYMDVADKEINQLIESQDDWVIALGLDLLNGKDSPPKNELIQRVFQIMRDDLQNATTYVSLAKWLDKDATIFDDIIARFDSENIHFQRAVLYSFYFAKKLTIETETLILRILQDANSKVRPDAVLPAGKCLYLRNEAITLLIKEFESNKWYNRAHAATAFAALKVNDINILKKIADLFGDIEGHDWSAQESAIQALGNLGELARPCIPDILILLINEMSPDDFENICENTVLDICETLSKVDDGTEPVISALINVVVKCNTVAVTSALRALGRFGEKSKAVIPFLDKYIFDDEYLEGDYMVDDATEVDFLKSLYKIAGAENKSVKAYIEKQKSSPLIVVRDFVNSFEKNIMLK